MESDKNFLDAKSYALRLIKFRLRSQKEITDKLKNKGYSLDVIRDVCDFLKKAKLLDDVLFAKLWVLGRINRPMGPHRLRYELKLKGVDENIIEEAIEKAGENYCEEGVIREIIKNKLKGMQRVSRDKARSRLYGYLVRRGYSKDLIMQALFKDPLLLKHKKSSR